MAQKESRTGIESEPQLSSDHLESPLCDYCDTFPGSYTCTGCKKRRYCGKKCQERSWETHIFDCDAKKPIKSFHHLARAISQDLLPTDQQTIDEWGFDRACFSQDGGPNMLFGLYTGLIRYLDIPAKTLDQWRKKGVLLQEIKKAYETLPANSRGGYFPWLLRNEYVLNMSEPLPTSPEAMANKHTRDGWGFAGQNRSAPDSVIRSGILSMPSRKQECLFLCGGLLNHCHPNPSQSLWINFGFCVGGQYSELCAGRLYQKLVTSATFQEILTAYETSGMVALFRKKGLTSNPDYRWLSEQFEDIMSGSGTGMRKSSWDLKQFVQVKMDDPSATFHMTNSVRFDYGFKNCSGAADLTALQKLFEEYFQSDDNNCIDLHNACIKGELFEYLSKFTKAPLTQQHRRLLKNSYPLPQSAF